MAGSQAASVLAGLIALQLVFGIVIPAVTSIQLDQGDCYLNQIPGRVCDFAYVTSGFSLFWSLLLAFAAWQTLKGGKGAFLQTIFASLSIFAAFWWMVASITFTIRGGQAADDGLPEETARNAVIGMSWVEAILFFFSFLAVIYDRIQHRKYRTQLDSSRSVLDLEQQQFKKQQFVATQVLGSTPLA